MDWYSYSRVLSELSQSFHVFAVSYHGHGMTRSPVGRLNAMDIGVDLTAFIEHVIGEPVFLTGIRLAACSRSGSRRTSRAGSGRSCSRIRRCSPRSFHARGGPSPSARSRRATSTSRPTAARTSAHWLASNQEFVVSRFGTFGYRLVVSGIETYRVDHPGERIELNFLPDIVRLLIRGLDVYDPHFGDAFYDGSWSEGFDQAEALQRVEAPTLLLHANFEYLEDGTLNGALDDADAARRDVTLERR